MGTLTEQQARLLTEPNYSSLATIRCDGTPHVTPVWVDWDGEHVLVNTAAGRAKEQHLRRDPRAGVLVVDRENPYEWVSVTGMAELTEGGADEHIDAMAKKYLDEDTYPFRKEGEQRVIFRIEPERVRHYGQ